MTKELGILLDLIIVTVLAGVVGYERERHGRAAGFRTHILVGVGACLVMLTGMHLMEALEGRAQFDPTRMAAQVISGIGFLGAGTILRFRASVRGLTTAASLWAVAGIGLAVGAGFLWGAVGATVIIVLALFGFSHLERRMRKDLYQTLIIELRSPSETLSKVRGLLGEYDVEIRDFDITRMDEPDMSRVELLIKLSSDHKQGDILGCLIRAEGVEHAQWG